MTTRTQSLATRAQIIAHASTTLNYAATARAFDLTRERVRQIITAHAPKIAAVCKQHSMPPEYRQIQRRYQALRARAAAVGQPFMLSIADAAEIVQDAAARHNTTTVILYRKDATKPWTKANTMGITRTEHRQRLGIAGMAARLQRLGRPGAVGHNALRATALAADPSERLTVKRYRALIGNCARRGIKITITYDEYRDIMLPSFRAAAKANISPRAADAPACVMIHKEQGYVPGNIRATTRSLACASRRNPSKSRRRHA